MEKSVTNANASRIFLIGMMGVGKSTIARLLAQRLEWVWIDTDSCIERNSCMSVSDIFNHFGEEEFRRREWECVRLSTKYHQVVVACGGGAPCFYNAMDFLLSAGIVIYLSARIETLVSHLTQENITRPLLLATDIRLEERLHILLEARTKVYQQAHFIIETDGRSEDEVVQRVMVQVSEVMRGGSMTLE